MCMSVPHGFQGPVQVREAPDPKPGVMDGSKCHGVLGTNSGASARAESVPNS